MDLNRRGLLAAVLGLVYPGLGHLSLRAWLRAFAWFVLSMVVAALLMPSELVTAFQNQGMSAFTTVTIPIELTLSLLVIRVLNAADAYLVAVRRAAPEPAPAANASGSSGEATATCPNCGRDLDGDLDFCPWCTYEFEDADDA